MYKLYVLKNGDHPGICLDWLEFFEKIDGMKVVKYKIFTYDTDSNEEDANVPHSMAWAFRMAREYLAEKDDEDPESSDEEAVSIQESDSDEGYDEEDDIEDETEAPVLGKTDASVRTDASAGNEAHHREDAQRNAAACDEDGWNEELRRKLGIRDDLRMGTPWLDMLLQLAGANAPRISRPYYVGRYSATSLYALLLYLILEPRSILDEVYENRESQKDSKSDAASKRMWYDAVETELYRADEYVELKRRFEALGLKKLDLLDVRVRNVEYAKKLSPLQVRPSYFNMRSFLMSGKHTIVDLYDELVGRDVYKDELTRISGAMINPDLSGKTSMAEEERQKSLEQLVEQTGAVRSALKEVVIGQDEAIDKLEQAFFHSEKRANMRAKKGPRSAFLFAGPPGVGKTYMAQNFAEKLGRPYHRFDMSSYGSVNAIDEIIGISSFYTNSKAGVLTSYVDENPNCVLLFDEIEKAHREVVQIFLQILDEGKCFDRFYDTNVSFEDCIVIMTTNAGKKLYENVGNENLSDLPDRVVIDGLEKDVDPKTGVAYFPPEIVSRMASHTIIMFNHLKAAAIRQVIKNDVDKNLAQNKETYGYDISKGSDIVAATVQYAVGGGGDARNASRLAGKLIDKELYELFSLLQEKTDAGEKGKLKRISWECDFAECSEEIRQFYLGEKDCIVPILKETDKEYTISASHMLKVVVMNDTRRFMETVRNANVLFAVIDYAYGLRAAEASMSISDAKTIGSDAFNRLKKENADIPVYLLKNDQNYLYSESEKRTLRKRGAESFIDEDNLVKQITQAYSDICCKNTMEKLSVRHQVLTFATRKEVSPDRTLAKIIFYNLKLEMAVDVEDKDSLISDELRPEKSWDDIYVSSDVRKELEYFIKYLKNTKEYIKTGARVPRGALMFGPPGTGKTSLAKVVASESKVNFLSVSADELLNKGSDKVHDIFRVARKYAPAVLFIDEIDAIGMSRRQTGANSVLNALLTEMDGFKRMDAKPVFVMAATNLKGLDAALARRFDRTFEVKLPDEEGRRWLLKRLLSLHSDILSISEEELESLVTRSQGLSPADLENIVEAALREGIRNGTVVTDAFFDEIFEKSHYGEKREKCSEKDVEQTAYHEAGHAIIELYYGRSPEYMSVIARTDFNGYVQAEQMAAHPTKERLLQQICTDMGGRAAEMEFGYGLTPGASGDLSMATRLATRMVCEFGMFEEEMGLAVLSPEEYKMDEKARALVNQILTEQLEQARNIVRENKDAIVRLVHAVLNSEQKYLTKKDIVDTYKGQQ